MFERVKKEKGKVRSTYSIAEWKALSAELVSLGHRSFTVEQLRDRFKILNAQGRVIPPAATQPSSTAAQPSPTVTAVVPPAVTSTRNQPSGRASWTSEADFFLIACLLDAKTQGKMSDNNFKPQVYSQAVLHLAEKGHSYTRKQVKARWTRFKGDFKIVSKLRGLSGFGWDPVRNLVTATDDVWDRYLAGHPKARPFRNQPFPHYNDIATLVEHSTATGEFALSLENPQNIDNASSDNGSDSSDDDSSDNEDKSPVKKRHAAAPPTTTPAPRSKRGRTSAGAQALENMSGSVAVLAEGFASGSLFAPPATDSPVKKEKAFNIVRAEEGLSPHSLAKARRVFRGPGEVAREYLSFNSKDEEEKEARHFWLLEEMERV
ncbi:hypothetical protein D9758_013915 [Tetrapyrgos nigripes]|uniref:Myb/SANT-like domain-containing protein n=1 Tax=Tetrapyrgos nigripes TaxID=182062 RepID=A0A8H5CMQ9_9AGAR|nr:hypothetical protein D9758_013915 [Tetrapyrgos nigripes]